MALPPSRRRIRRPSIDIERRERDLPVAGKSRLETHRDPATEGIELHPRRADAACAAIRRTNVFDRESIARETRVDPLRRRVRRNTAKTAIVILLMTIRGTRGATPPGYHGLPPSKRAPWEPAEQSRDTCLGKQRATFNCNQVLGHHPLPCAPVFLSRPTPAFLVASYATMSRHITPETGLVYRTQTAAGSGD
jgi:hypothetical protein